MKDTAKKILFKDRLIAWSEENLGVKFDRISNVQQSRQMIKFFVSEILEKLNPGIVPDDEAELDDSIIDGSGDGGADLIYRTDDGHVLIIQAKYRGKEPPESPEAVGRFCDLQQRLFLANQGKQQSLHKDLLEIAGQIDWAEDNFQMFFISTGKSGKAVDDRVEQGIVPIPDYPDLPERTVLRFLDLSGLNKEIREAISSADFADHLISIPMIPDEENRPWCHFVGVDRELYIGEVSGAVLANVLQEYRASLFTMNIRDYVGDSKTNKEIIKTALNSPTNFEYFNNGVTAVAGRITSDKSTNTLTCEKMSIINGAQTVRSLLAATNAKKGGGGQYKPVSSVRVLMRLVSFVYPAEVAFVGQVTRFNNTQNAVKISDFRSNDEVQKDIARRFSNLNLGGKSYEYKNKRSGAKKRNSILVTLEELTKGVYAFRFGPDDMAGGSSKMFDSTSAGLYTQVFEHPDSPLTEAAFSLIAGTYFACSHVKSLWEAERKVLRSQGKTMHRALERKGLIYFAVGELERQSYAKHGRALDHDLMKLAKPNNWLPDAESHPCLALSKAFTMASKILVQQYGIKEKTVVGFKHRNWFRDPDTLEDIRSAIELVLDMGSPPFLWP